MKIFKWHNLNFDCVMRAAHSHFGFKKIFFFFSLFFDDQNETWASTGTDTSFGLVMAIILKNIGELKKSIPICIELKNIDIQ